MWTEQDIPDQRGRVAVVTGANTGLGFETARALAEHGASVVLAVRDVAKGKQAAARMRGDVTVQELDLTSLDSVRAAAAGLRAGHERIDLLINNAGVMYTPKLATRDGFEMQFGTNHLGHFAFTGLLLDLMLPVPGSRVVTVSSVGHRIRAAIHFEDLQWERSYSRVGAYGQSKLANLMFTYELQRRLAAHGRAAAIGATSADGASSALGVGDGHGGSSVAARGITVAERPATAGRGATTVAVAAHPGMSNTELARNAPAAIRVPLTWMAPVITQRGSMGALPTLRAAVDPAVLGGQYYGPDGMGEVRGHPQIVTSSPQSYDLALQQRLWAVSEDLTGVQFPV